MKNIKFLLALVVLVGLTACGPGQKLPTWQEQYDLGVRYLSEGNYEEAIIAFTAAIEIDPNEVTSYLSLSDAYESAGDFEKAEEVLKRGYQLTRAEILEQARIRKVANRSISDEQKAVLNELLTLFSRGDIQGIADLIVQNNHQSKAETGNFNFIARDIYEKILNGEALAFDGEKFQVNWDGSALVIVHPRLLYYGELKHGIPNGDGIMFNAHTWHEDGNVDITVLKGTWSDGYVIGEAILNDITSKTLIENEYQHLLPEQHISCTFNSKEIMAEGTVSVLAGDSNGEHSVSYTIREGKAVLNGWDISEAGADKMCEVHNGTCGVEFHFNKPGHELFQNTMSWYWYDKEIPTEMGIPWCYGLDLIVFFSEVRP